MDKETPTIQDLLLLIGKSFQPERAQEFEGTIQMHLTGSQGGDWFVTIENGDCMVETGVNDRAKLTIEADTQDILDMYSGKLDPVRGYMLGRIKAKGDKMLALRMMTLFKVER